MGIGDWAQSPMNKYFITKNKFIIYRILRDIGPPIPYQRPQNGGLII